MKKKRTTCRTLVAAVWATAGFLFWNAAAFSFERHVAALDWTPVLNTPDIRSVFGGSDGRTLLTDEKGAVRALEFMAFPGTVFKVVGEQAVRGVQMYRVETAEYPYSGDAGYFIPAEFTREVPGGASQRTVRLPKAEDVLARMWSWEGLPYVWGGNASMGAVGVLDYFLVRPEDSQGLLDQWMLKGMDCSGLLFAATDGWTPRNTSALVRYGEPVEIRGKGAQEIAAHVKPLDLIVWDGHVVIVLDETQTVESRMDHEPERPGLQGGVRVRGLEHRLREILVERIPVNAYDDCKKNEECFVVRRWYEAAADDERSKNLTDERKRQ